MRAAFGGLPLAAATAVTEEIVELRAGFPTVPLRARGGAKPDLQDSQKVGRESHAFCDLAWLRIKVALKTLRH